MPHGSARTSLASGFETTFQFQITQAGGTGHGADGFAFLLQGPEALGGRGPLAALLLWIRIFDTHSRSECLRLHQPVAGVRTME